MSEEISNELSVLFEKGVELGKKVVNEVWADKVIDIFSDDVNYNIAHRQEVINELIKLHCENPEEIKVTALKWGYKEQSQEVLCLVPDDLIAKYIPISEVQEIFDFCGVRLGLLSQGKLFVRGEE